MRIKKALQTLSVMLLLPVAWRTAAAQPAVYKADPVHSKVGFSIRHLVSDVDGRFKEFEGTIKYDAQHPADSSVQFTVQAASINTGTDDRDKHLRSPDFFDVAKFPTLSFTSTKVVPKGNNAYDVTGNLTIRGVTKTVTIPAKFRGEVKSPMGERAGFESTFTVNRLDYGVAWNRAIEGGGTILGDDVDVSIRIEAVKQGAAAAK
ncbi:MAG TPA: YceI family protein [Thermoanaerobaculia bacterium]|jgi:polyisoprenoid-binding protein YceI|nr:YceI family protein [Thermoanaerobaculia bacterium]